MGRWMITGDDMTVSNPDGEVELRVKRLESGTIEFCIASDWGVAEQDYVHKKYFAISEREAEVLVEFLNGR